MSHTLYANTWAGPRKVAEVVTYRPEPVVTFDDDRVPYTVRPEQLFITADTLHDCPDCGGDGWVVTPIRGINAPDSHDETECVACGGTGLAG